MTLLEEIDHLILRQFSQSKKLKNIIHASVTPFQETLEHLKKLDEGHFVDDARGHSLDIIGDIVDFQRGSMGDDEYKIWLKVAILLNCGQGRARDVFNILHVLYMGRPPIEIEENGFGVVHINIIKIKNMDHVRAIQSIIRRAVPAGIRCTFGGVKAPAELSIRSNGHQKSLPIFRFDTTGFDNSVFADFI